MSLISMAWGLGDMAKRGNCHGEKLIVGVG